MKEEVREKIRENHPDIDKMQEQAEDIKQWYHFHEMHQTTELIRKTSEFESPEEFKERLMISNICKEDDFYIAYKLNLDEVT